MDIDYLFICTHTIEWSPTHQFKLETKIYLQNLSLMWSLRDKSQQVGTWASKSKGFMYYLCMYVCRTIITNYLHINVNYHTKPLARKSLVFVYQPIICYNKLMLHNLSSTLSHYFLIFSFYLYSFFLLQLRSFSFYVFIYVFYV